MTLYDIFQVLHDVKHIYITNNKGELLTVLDKNTEPPTELLEKVMSCTVLYITPLACYDVRIDIDTDETRERI